MPTRSLRGRHLNNVIAPEDWDPLEPSACTEAMAGTLVEKQSKTYELTVNFKHIHCFGKVLSSAQMQADAKTLSEAETVKVIIKDVPPRLSHRKPGEAFPDVVVVCENESCNSADTFVYGHPDDPEYSVNLLKIKMPKSEAAATFVIPQNLYKWQGPMVKPATLMLGSVCYIDS